MGCFCTVKEPPEVYESESESEYSGLYLPNIKATLPFQTRSRRTSPTLQSEYNDTLLERWPTGFELTPSMENLRQISTRSRDQSFLSRQPTLTYTSSLAQYVQFKLGTELFCMSWNMNHDLYSTPFDFYCDFRTMQVSEIDSVMVEIIWDISRVFFFLENPSELCSKTLLSQVVPSCLLSEDVLKAFSIASEIKKQKWSKVMNFPNYSLYDFLMAAEGLGKGSLSQMDLQQGLRATNPLRQNYDPEAVIHLIAEDVLLLPLLIVDSLHLMIVKLTVFLLRNNIEKAFSEYELNDQIETFKRFLENPWQNSLGIPKLFASTKERLYEKWNSIFEDTNKIRQILSKVDQTNADIIFLQQIRKGVFVELSNELANQYVIFPSKFPSEELETSAILVLRDAIQLVQPRKEKRIDHMNFAVLCSCSQILFYVGVVSLPPGEDSGQERRNLAIKLRKMIGGDTAAIIGGEFSEDLTVPDNPISKLMYKAYNGIDHNQNEPLSSHIHRTRTHAQFDFAMAENEDTSVSNCIFSTFPLVGDAFSDFRCGIEENPTKHGPVYQRISPMVL